METCLIAVVYSADVLNTSHLIRKYGPFQKFLQEIRSERDMLDKKHVRGTDATVYNNIHNEENADKVG